MKITHIILSVALLGLAAGCDTGKESTAHKEQAMTEKNQSHLLTVQPPVQLDWSLEREQLNKRAKLWNDPNKVAWIYLVNYGKIMGFYTIKGKVSSVNSQITNPEQIAMRRYKTGGNRYTHVLPSPAEDGSYGENGQAVFFFTADGAYVEWRGDYMLVDKPLKMSTPPVLVREVGGAKARAEL